MAGRRSEPFGLQLVLDIEYESVVEGHAVAVAAEHDEQAVEDQAGVAVS